MPTITTVEKTSTADGADKTAVVRGSFSKKSKTKAARRALRVAAP